MKDPIMKIFILIFVIGLFIFPKIALAELNPEQMIENSLFLLLFFYSSLLEEFFGGGLVKKNLKRRKKRRELSGT